MTTVVAKLTELEGQVPTYTQYKQLENETTTLPKDTELGTVTLLQLEQQVKETVLAHHLNQQPIQPTEIDKITAVLTRDKTLDEVNLPKPNEEDYKKFELEHPPLP